MSEKKEWGKTIWSNNAVFLHYFSCTSEWCSDCTENLEADRLKYVGADKVNKIKVNLIFIFKCKRFD